MEPQILAVRGASSIVIQALLLSCARRWQHAGMRVVGIVEIASSDGRKGKLMDVSNATQYDLYQDLGGGSKACRLFGGGVIEACESVCLQITQGCDLVVLSKFGKLESQRSGLIAAFQMAVSCETPLLTAVSPTFAPQWESFAGPLAKFSDPNEDSIEAWRERCASASTGTGRT